MTNWTRSFRPRPPMPSCWATTCWTLLLSLEQIRRTVSEALSETQAAGNEIFTFSLRLLQAISQANSRANCMC